MCLGGIPGHNRLDVMTDIRDPFVEEKDIETLFVKVSSINSI